MGSAALVVGVVDVAGGVEETGEERGDERAKGWCGGANLVIPC